MPQPGKAPNTLFKVGDWVKARRHYEQRIGVVVAANWETVTFHWEKSPNAVTLPYREARWYCVVMRPGYRSGREDLKPWMVPGTVVARLFQPEVYEIVEVRGYWLKLQDQVSGIFHFCRAKEASRYSRHLNRLQRV